MSNKSITANKNKDGDQSIQLNETDSPIIPIAHLERLHQFRPDIVDWVIKQTQAEGEHRRSESTRVNTFIFIERIFGQVFAFLIGLAAIAVGGYMALHGQPWAGATIASIAITGLAGVYLIGHKDKSK